MESEKMLYAVTRQSQIEAIDKVVEAIDGRASVLDGCKSNLLDIRELLVRPESEPVILDLQKIIEETVYDILKWGERDDKPS